MEIIEIIVFAIVEMPHVITMGKFKEKEEARQKYFGFGFLFYFFIIFITLMITLICWIT